MDNTFLAQFYGKSQNYTDIPNHLYKDYNVKKGLRNEDGTGVLVGLTRVADVVGYTYNEDGTKVDIIIGEDENDPVFTIPDILNKVVYYNQTKRDRKL